MDACEEVCCFFLERIAHVYKKRQIPRYPCTDPGSREHDFQMPLPIAIEMRVLTETIRN